MAEAAAAVDPELAGETLADLHHRFDEIGGYAARARAATLLAGLGFPVARHGDPVASFSGGWRMRLNLAQALMCRSDLLLLDEPTNHLDLDAVLWLEDWLVRYPGHAAPHHARPRFPRRRRDVDRPRRRAEAEDVHRQLLAVRARARAAARVAAGDLREAAAPDRAPAVVRRPLPREGDQGEAGAKPHQGAGADGAHRRGARRQPVRVLVPAGGRRREAARAPRARHAGLRQVAAASSPTSTGRSWPASASACSVPTAPASRRC